MPKKNSPVQTEQIHCDCPLLGFVGCSGTGKTTLLKQVIPLLKAHHLKLGIIKHAHHTFDIDIPGKDSYELRKAGADQMLIASQNRWALVTETPEHLGDPDLQTLLAQLDEQLDLVLVEGFKHVPFPKIELHRASLKQPLLFPEDPHIIAIASDTPLTVACPLPRLDLNQPTMVAEFVLRFIHTQQQDPVA